MKDKQFWDIFLSSMEDLKEEPPSSVKEGIFQNMDRYYRRRRRWKRGMVGTLGVCALGLSSFFFLDDLGGGSDELPGDQVEIPASAVPKGPGGPNMISSSGDAAGAFGDDEFQEKALASKKSSSKEKEGGQAKDERPRGEGMEGKPQQVADATKGSSSKGSERTEDKAGASEERKAGNEPSENLEPSDNLQSSGRKEKGSDTKGNAKASKGAGQDPNEELEEMPPRLPTIGDVEPDKAGMSSLASLGEKDRSSMQVPRFFIGSDLTFNFTRLMDQRTLESFEATSLVSTDADIHFDYGITGGVRLNRRTKVLGRYFMKKDVGQRYAHYVDGRYRSEGIQLSYSNYELLLEHDLTQGYLKAKHRTYLSIYGGGHYAHLRKAERKEEGRVRSVTGRFKKRSFGLDGGFRMGIETKAGLDVGLLLGASYSLTSIRGVDSDDMLMKSNARNLSYGGGLSLRYYFGSGL